MDDMTEFERDLAEELDEMAGPSRRIDALAMARAASTRPARWGLRSMFSATRVVLAGSLVALVLAFLVVGRAPTVPEPQVVPGAASASPSVPATLLPGLVTEEVEPGVLRIIRDDAGHDLDAGHPDFRLDLDGITIASDGTIWLTTSAHDTDNGAGLAGPPFWALGRPGGVIPPARTDPIPLADGSILFLGDPDYLFDGTTLAPDRGPAVRPVPGGMLWLLAADGLMDLVPDGATIEPPVDRLAMIWDVDEGRWSTVSEGLRSVRSGHHTCRPTSSGVSCVDESRGTEVRYLRGTNINQVAVAPDGAIWAVGAFEDQGGGLYRITPG